MAGRGMSKRAQQQRQAELDAHFAERRRWYAVDSDGNRVNKGDKVVTFRGEEREFGMVSAFPTPGKSGKVVVTDPNVAKDKWFHSQEFYPSVINVELRREPDED